MITVKVTGLNELLSTLRALPQAVAPAVLGELAMTALTPVAQDMAAHAPRLTGEGAASIGPVVTKAEGQQVTVAVGPNRQALLESGLGFAEFGTRHQPARPWMRPAWDSHKERVQRDFGGALFDRIGRAARARGRS